MTEPLYITFSLPPFVASLFLLPCNEGVPFFTLSFTLDRYSYYRATKITLSCLLLLSEASSTREPFMNSVTEASKSEHDKLAISGAEHF